MELSINTPALLFPAITFLMIVYGNRFLSLANLIRSLHERYNTSEKDRASILKQIKNLRTRLTMIKYMQVLGVVSFIICIACMYQIFVAHYRTAHWLFAASLFFTMLSMVLSILEIQISTVALEHELSDMEDLESSNVIVDYIKETFDKHE